MSVTVTASPTRTSSQWRRAALSALLLLAMPDGRMRPLPYAYTRGCLFQVSDNPIDNSLREAGISISTERTREGPRTIRGGSAPKVPMQHTLGAQAAAWAPVIL